MNFSPFIFISSNRGWICLCACVCQKNIQNMYTSQFLIIHSNLVNAVFKQFNQLRNKETVLNGVYSPKWLSFLAPAFLTQRADN